jgi:hypothetical protein
LLKSCFIKYFLKIYIFNIFTDNQTRRIRGLAYDPVEDTIYWTDKTNRAIFKVVLPNKIISELSPTILHKLDDQEPSAIAVDHCNR